MSSLIVSRFLSFAARGRGGGAAVRKQVFNNSGGALAVGDVVIWDTATARGDAVTTTTTQDDKLVAGVCLQAFADQTYGYIAVPTENGNYVATVKVNGTTDIAVGDYLSTFTTVKIAAKATAGKGGVFAIALAAYATDDSAGEIAALVLRVPPDADGATSYGTAGQMAADGIAAANNAGATAASARIDHVHTHTADAPTLTFGTSNSAGTAGLVLAADATIAIFDTTVPTSILPDTASATGSAAFAARRDHVHAMTGAAPADGSLAAANAEGVATSFSRSDHAHRAVLTDNVDLELGTGYDATLRWDTSDANANSVFLQLPAAAGANVPVVVIGQSISGNDLGLFNGIVDPVVAVFATGAVTTSVGIRAYKSRGTVAAPTVITTGDDLLTLSAFGYGGASGYVESARILLESTGTIADTRVGGRISLQVATDAAPSVLTERVAITGSLGITLTPATDTFFANGTGIVLGHTAQVAVGAVTPEMQELGTAPADSSLFLGAWSADTAAPRLYFAKSRNAAIGSFTIVTTGDLLGQILAFGDDGVDFNSNGNASAAIEFSATGTIAADRVPGKMSFQVATDAAPSVLTERAYITSSGFFAKDITIDHAAATSAVLLMKYNSVDEFQISANGTRIDAWSNARQISFRGAVGVVIGGTEGSTTAVNGGYLRTADMVGGTTSNAAGSDLTISAGLGTGTGDVGQIIIRTPRVAGAGTDLQSLTTILTLDANLLLVEGGATIQADAATEIGISVNNSALVVGSAGSLISPYLSSTGAAFTDAIGGDVNGALGINYDSDTGPTTTLEARSNGVWVSVALSGTLHPGKREYDNVGKKQLANPKQVFEEDGRYWVDESKCYVCGEAMEVDTPIVFHSNARRSNGDLHSIYSHLRCEMERLDKKAVSIV